MRWRQPASPTTKVAQGEAREEKKREKYTERATTAANEVKAGTDNTEGSQTAAEKSLRVKPPVPQGPRIQYNTADREKGSDAASARQC